MSKSAEVFLRVSFFILLLIFAIAFFWYKQYAFSFLTLMVILIFSRWNQIKKLVAGNGRVEMEIMKEKDKDKE